MSGKHLWPHFDFKQHRKQTWLHLVTALVISLISIKTKFLNLSSTLSLNITKFWEKRNSFSCAHERLFFCLMTFPKLACGLGWFVGGFLFALGFLFVGRGGVLNGHKVQNKDFRCESLILKFLGVAEPTSEQGVETPRN